MFGQDGSSFKLITSTGSMHFATYKEAEDYAKANCKEYSIQIIHKDPEGNLVEGPFVAGEPKYE